MVEGTEATAWLDRGGTLALHGEGEPRLWTFPADTIPQSFVATQRHFVDCVRNGAAPETGGPETLRTMALVFGAYRSSEEGRVVALAELD
jgi:predicted dehydrogenase